MALYRQIWFWLLALLVFGGLLVLLSNVLLPFLAGLTLAYLLDPIANRLERQGMPRLAATMLIMTLFVMTLVLILVLVMPILSHQLASFIANMPSYVVQLQNLLAQQGAPLIERIGGTQALSEVQTSLGDIVSQSVGWIVGIMKSLWSGGQAIVGLIGLVVVTPVVAFYLLLDWDRMIGTIDGWLPRPQQNTVRGLAREINAAIAGFIRGQTTVCVILGVFYAFVLTLLGLNFGVLIGLGAGLLTFIPYIGSFVGLIVSVGVALVQFWPDWIMVAATLGVFLFGQFVEGNILSPKLVGASVGLHPVWLMFALLAFGSLFGFAGLLIAVPLAAAFGVLARFALQQYLTSSFYHGAASLPNHDV